jgi:hypothetical protein
MITILIAEISNLQKLDSYKPKPDKKIESVYYNIKI